MIGRRGTSSNCVNSPNRADAEPGGEAMRLQDKVAIVTGAAWGMGAATARLFASEGAKVVVADVLEAEGQAVAQLDQVEPRRGPLPAPRRRQREGLGCSGGRHARRLRQDRHPRQQCRRERQRSRPPQLADLGPADEHQCQGRVPRHARGHPGDAEGQGRLDRQHLLDLGRRRPEVRAHGLQRRQGRRAHHEQGGGGAVRRGTASASTRCIRG